MIRVVVREPYPSSATGACGRHERHDSYGIRFVTTIESAQVNIAVRQAEQ
jgi:hypothetical protein